jgi:hypothetical protein
LKQLILLLTFVFSSFIVEAQQAYYFDEFGIGTDISYERGYTNITTQTSHFSANLNLVYYYGPFASSVAEFQYGTLSGGGPTPKADPFGRQYVNHYAAFILRTDYQLGGIIGYSRSDFVNFLKNFYGGTGIGLVDNNNTVQRYSIYQSTYRFPGADKSINVDIPLRFGYEFKFYNNYQEPYIAIDLCYVHSVVFGEGLDGYNDPPSKFRNLYSDQYRQILLGIKLNFGNPSQVIK